MSGSELVGILESEGYSLKALDVYSQIGSVRRLDIEPHFSPETSVLVVRLRYQVNNELLSKFPRVHSLVTPTTGLQHLDLDAIADRNIQLYSLRDVRGELHEITSTAELALGLILSLIRHIPSAHEDVVSKNSWNRMAFKGRQLSALTIGLVGAGRVGSQLARFLKALGAEVIYSDPDPDVRSRMIGFRGPLALHDLLQESDIVSLHASADQQSPILAAEEFATMKRGTLLVNTARAHLVEEASLAEALRSGHLGGLAMDVLSGEQREGFSPETDSIVQLYRNGGNIIVTPHLGGCTQEGMEKTEEIMAKFVTQSLMGRNV